MRRALLVAAALAVATPAAADTLDALYGNTLVVTYPSGNAHRFHIDENGAITLIAQTGERHYAMWRVEGDQFCVTSDSGSPSCAPLPQDKAVGDTWQLETPAGVARYEIVAGR